MHNSNPLLPCLWLQLEPYIHMFDSLFLLLPSCKKCRCYIYIIKITSQISHQISILMARAMHLATLTFQFKCPKRIFKLYTITCKSKS